MKVGLIGFFGVGALSDDLILDATKRLILKERPKTVFDELVMWRSVKDGRVDVDYLNGFDLLVLCGGSLLGKCTFQPVNAIASWHDKVDTPLAIMGTGYRFEPRLEPLADDMRQRMRLLFKKAYPIMLRGLRTVYHCGNNGIPLENVKCLGEPIIGAGYDSPTRRRSIIGGNVRNMPWNEVQYTDNTVVQKLLAQVYDWLIEETGMDVELLALREYPDDNDLEGALRVVKMMRNGDRVHIGHKLTIGELRRVMNYSFWFGARCHPAVYCAAVGIPFVGFEAQFNKMEDFLSVHKSSCYITAFGDLEKFKEKYKEAMDTEYQKALKESVWRNSREIQRFVREMLGVTG